MEQLQPLLESAAFSHRRRILVHVPVGDEQILPAVQIVMLSGYEDTVLREAGEKAGLYAYLVKGCAPDVLWRTIRFALNSQAKR